MVLKFNFSSFMKFFWVFYKTPGFLGNHYPGRSAKNNGFTQIPLRGFLKKPPKATTTTTTTTTTKTRSESEVKTKT
jgi:hypothetical protein